GRRVEIAAGAAVHLEEGGAEDLGERPLPRPAKDFHFEQPVLRLDVAVGEAQVVETAREDVRHAVGVAQHRAGRLVERGADGLREGRRARAAEQRDDGRQGSPDSSRHGYLRFRPNRRNGRFAAAWSLPMSTRTWMVRSDVPSKVERSAWRPRTLRLYRPSRRSRRVTDVIPAGLDPAPLD